MNSRPRIHATFILSSLLVVCAACQAVVSPTPTFTLTPTTTVTPTAESTRASAYIIDVPFHYLSVKQTVLKDSQISIRQWQRIEVWLSYWIKCDNPPLDPAAEMHWDLLFDDPDDPTESFMVISTGGAFYTTPVSSYGVWLDPPTSACQGTLDPAYAPLLLASGEDLQWLRVQHGKIVHVDTKGQIVETIELKGVQSDKDAIDPSMFHTLPSNYEYLKAHPDEFVQAPDPVSSRAGFDRWFTEQLVPALGPLSEREVNVNASVGPDVYGYSFYVWPLNPTKGQLAFFYFESSGILYQVPCINISEIALAHDEVDWTICIAILTGPSFWYYVNEVSGLAEGRGLNQGQIYKDFRGRPDLDFGDAEESMIDSIGDYTLGANNIGFGMGSLFTVHP